MLGFHETANVVFARRSAYSECVDSTLERIQYVVFQEGKGEGVEGRKGEKEKSERRKEKDRGRRKGEGGGKEGQEKKDVRGAKRRAW